MNKTLEDRKIEFLKQIGGVTYPPDRTGVFLVIKGKKIYLDDSLLISEKKGFYYDDDGEKYITGGRINFKTFKNIIKVMEKEIAK